MVQVFFVLIGFAFLWKDIYYGIFSEFLSQNCRILEFLSLGLWLHVATQSAQKEANTLNWGKMTTFGRLCSPLALMEEYIKIIFPCFYLRKCQWQENFHKMFYALNVETIETISKIRISCCQAGWFPVNYVGIPLHVSKQRKGEPSHIVVCWLGMHR
jgi:hypothetical protein